MDGTALAHQQIRAMAWLINVAAGTYDAHYHPSERDTAFALGRAFVGQQIVKLSKMPPEFTRREENDDDRPSIRVPIR